MQASTKPARPGSPSSGRADPRPAYRPPSHHLTIGAILLFLQLAFWSFVLLT